MSTLIFLLVTNMVSQAVVWCATSEHYVTFQNCEKVDKVVEIVEKLQQLPAQNTF